MEREKKEIETNILLNILKIIIEHCSKYIELENNLVTKFIE